jgi:thiol-disulfide isomerase/thioredoxin
MLNKMNVIIGLLIIIILILLLTNFRITNKISQQKEDMIVNLNKFRNPQRLQQAVIPEYDMNTPYYGNTNLIDNRRNALVLYYTDWCSHSMRFVPIYDKFKCNFDKFAKENNIKIIITKVDCEQNRGKCSDFGVQGFPSVTLHTADGRLIKYEGPRTVLGLYNFVRKNLSPKCIPALSYKKLNYPECENMFKYDNTCK